MTPMEKVEAAITKLEQQKAAATYGEWTGWQQGHPSHGLRFGIENALGDDVAKFACRADTEIVVTLHRTIDAQLAILRQWVEYRPLVMELCGLALADAILGDAS